MPNPLEDTLIAQALQKAEGIRPSVNYADGIDTGEAEHLAHESINQFGGVLGTTGTGSKSLFRLLSELPAFIKQSRPAAALVEQLYKFKAPKLPKKHLNQIALGQRVTSHIPPTSLFVVAPKGFAIGPKTASGPRRSMTLQRPTVNRENRVNYVELLKRLGQPIRRFGAFSSNMRATPTPPSVRSFDDLPTITQGQKTIPEHKLTIRETRERAKVRK